MQSLLPDPGAFAATQGAGKMATTFRKALVAAIVGLSGMVAVPAFAQGLTLEFGNRDGGRLGVYSGEDGYYPHERRYAMRPGCSPDRALDKADGMGIDDARISRVTPRRIVVLGYEDGDPARVTFGRSPGCPVIGED
jgi:hypothetical protein